MKFLTVLSVLLVSVTADARSIIVNQHEVLPNVMINGEQTPYVGVLDMSFVNNKIQLVIYNDICRQFTAGPGEMICRAMAMPVATLEVPMQKRENSCGSFIYSGVKELRPVDGNRTEINVTDNTHRLCKDVVDGLIVVNASTISARTQETTTYYLTK